MSDAESNSDFDEVAHEKLVASINDIGRSAGKKKSVTIRKSIPKISPSDLVAAIHSTRNLQDVKKELQKKRKKKPGEGLPTGTLQAPLHRQARDRIASSVAYSEIRKDLDVWTSVVQKNRIADQISFPLESDDLPAQSGTEKKQGFTPRTALEVEMANVLGTSKNNLGNEDMYTEAEKELIKAMSLKEAKAKCAQLQKMRALISYREAKLKRQAKIKSKSYHRHLKRQKRKQLIKEFDELLVKDPEAAKEKLAEIERQRILERATLKHRAGSKRTQLLARHAAKDPVAKKALEEQIRLGRELAEKHSMEHDSDSESEDEEGQMTAEQLLEKAVELAAKEDVLETSASNPQLLVNLRKMRQNEKAESRKAVVNTEKARAAESAKEAEKPDESKEIEWEEDVNWHAQTRDSSTKVVKTAEGLSGKESEQLSFGRPSDDEGTLTLKKDDKNAETVGKRKRNLSEENLDDSGKMAKNSKKKKKLKKAEETKKVRFAEDATVDTLFDQIEGKLLAAAVESARKFRDTESASTSQSTEPTLKPINEKRILSKRKAVSVNPSQRKDDQVDISMDPKHFLQVETKALTQVPADLMEKVDEFDAQVEQEALVAEIFQDDDVIASFEAEKAATEEAERPKDIDLTLAGWGSWTGPGISSTPKERFVIKAKEKKRKDQGRYGVIISESVDSSIEKVQPRSVPFPYTTVEDYEAVVRQPIGKDWNTPGAFHNLTKPNIVTKSGKIIRPLDKDSILKEKAKEVSDEED